MILLVAFVILGLADLYLALLGVVALLQPSATHEFLRSFAQTARANLIEVFARLAAGLSFVVAGDFLPFPIGFRMVGAFLAFTAILMLLLPRQHRKLASHSVATIAPHIRLFGAASLGLSALLGAILWGGIETAGLIPHIDLVKGQT